MTDDELRSMLRTWEAPPAPKTLEARVFARHPESFSWIRWLLSGQIRVPVPLALALAVVLAFVLYRAVRPPVASLSEFEQVRQLQPRIVRTIHEDH